MSRAFETWLPGNTVAPALAQGALADMVDGWAEAWFAGERPRALGSLSRITEVRGELRKVEWHGGEDGLAIGLPQAGLAALGAAVLDLAPSAVRAEPDVALLERVGGDCLDELKRRVAALFSGAAWRACDRLASLTAVHRVDIGDSQRRVVLTLELSAECFARFVKAKLAAPPEAPALGKGADALAALPVTLSVAVGRCGLSVAELSGLAAGDVLILDRAVEGPLPLAVQGVPVRRGACTLTERGDRIALTITEALAA